ncbi:MAG: InlB B-repeat-containing protein [Candidatus Adiutricales bacterium]
MYELFAVDSKMNLLKIVILVFSLIFFLPGISPAEIVDNNDGTVTDTSTGLHWQKLTAGPMNWESALNYCENLILAGYTDWRLPNITELRSIVDYGRSNPALDPQLFPDTALSPYWSATTYAFRTYYAWGLDFHYGYDLGLSKSNSYHLRAVRSGESGLFNVFVNSSGGGSTDKDGVNTVNPGDSMVITATPVIGFYFNGWSGDAGGAENPLTISDIASNMSITAEFSSINYLVTVSSVDGGSTDKEGANTISHGGSITMTATPMPGYHFTGWSGDATGSINPMTVSNITSNMSITANFAINTYTVTFTAVAGGSIAGETSQVVEHGNNCTTVTAVPNPGNGHYFTGWTGDYSGTNNPLTITSVTSDMTITANFANTYTVIFAVGPGGSLAGAPSQTVVYGGSSTAVTAVPDTGYHFNGWSGSFNGTPNPLTITNVTSDMTVTANFAVNTYTVTFLAGAGGSLVGTLSQTMDHGGSSTAVTAVPDDGFSFTGWTGDTAGTANPLIISNVTSGMAVTANFTINIYEVHVSSSTGGGTDKDGVTMVNHGDSLTITAMANTNYHFTGWDGDAAGSINPLIVSNITSDVFITANFALDTYTVTFTAGAGGNIDGETSQVVEHGKNCAMVTAVPDLFNGYYFSGWSGDYTGTANPLTITNVTSDMTVMANFANVYTADFTAGAGGTVTGTLSQTVAYGGSSTAVTAVPDDGFSFIGWTGDITGTTNPLIISNVASGMAVTANFTINTYEVHVSSTAGGSTDKDGVTTIDFGNALTINATPDTGYHFNGWSGDASGLTNPLTISNITSDKTVNANFSLNTYTVTFTAGSGGILTGNVSQRVEHGNDCTEITAIADIGNGESFVGWTGDYTGTDNPLTITDVTSNMNIVALFTDNISPTISELSPADNTTKVALNTIVTATFSEVMNPSSINISSFVLKEATRSVVSGTVSYDQATNTAFFTPSLNLAGNTEYLATIYTDVEDVNGNTLTQPRLWVFTTAMVENVQPAVDDVHPFDGSNWAMPNTRVTVRFSEDMNPQTIDEDSFKVTDAAGAGVSGTVAYYSEANSAYFTPASDFILDTTYTATMADTITDLAGNQLIQAKTWNFTIVHSIIDSDGDGLVDVLDDQPNDASMASPLTVTGKGNLTISGATLSNVQTLPDFDPSLIQIGKPEASEFSFPYGLIRFSALVPNAGDSATITIVFPEDIENETRYYKVTDAGFEEFAGAVFSGSRTVTLSLTDGGAGDRDGVANGVILDPGGLAVSRSGSGRGSGEGSGGTGGQDDSDTGGIVDPSGPGSDPDSSSGKASGGGGCFITALSASF